MNNIEEVIVPITDEVSVSSHLINTFVSLAFMYNEDEMSDMIEVLTEKAFDEVYPKYMNCAIKSFDKMYEEMDIVYYKKVWNVILEKGRDRY